jgi:hypothetical protein
LGSLERVLFAFKDKVDVEGVTVVSEMESIILSEVISTVVLQLEVVIVVSKDMDLSELDVVISELKGVTVSKVEG